MKKTAVTTFALSAIFLSLSGCSTVSANGNYKIDSKQQNIIETNLNQQILESSVKIQKQLELLNDIKDTRQVSINGKIEGIAGEYKIPLPHNMRDIEPDDIKLMVEEGRSNNNPNPKFNKIIEKNVTSERIIDKPSHLDKLASKNFYKEPVKNSYQQIDLTKINKNVEKANLTPIDLNKIDSRPRVEQPIVREKVIAQSATQSATQSANNNKMSEIKQETPTTPAPNISLDRSVTLQGSYDITDLLKQLSAGAGYQFVLVGNNKEGQINIGTQAEAFNGTIKDALIAIGTALGNNGIINVNTQDRTIHLEYK